MYDIVIKNGMIVTAQGTILGDLAISGEKIALVAPEIDAPASMTIDAEGKYLLPGLVDPHTHFSSHQPGQAGADDFTSGSRAALLGGVTTVVDHPEPVPESYRLEGPIQEHLSQAEGRSYVDYSFHSLVQELYKGFSSDLELLAAQGITSLKASTTDPWPLSPEDLSRLFVVAGRAGVLVTAHGEDHQAIRSLRQLYGEHQLLGPYYYALSRPNGAEAQGVQALLQAAEAEDDAPVYILHLSCREALDVVREARARGQRRIFVETCPHYLLLDSRLYLQGPDSAKYVLCPPLRSPADNEALWDGLASGVIQTLASDHRAFTLEQKLASGAEGEWDFRQCPLGVPGVEQRLDLLYHYGVQAGRLSIERLVAVCAANPARIFGLYPRKGLLAPGSDADIVIYDGQRKHTLSQADSHGAGDYCIYEGRRVTGGVDGVLLRGKLAVEKGQLLAGEPRGVFLPRAKGFQQLENLI